MRLLLQSYLQIRRAGDPSHCISESFSFKRKKDSFNIKSTKFGKMKIVFLITTIFTEVPCLKLQASKTRRAVLKIVAFQSVLTPEA